MPVAEQVGYDYLETLIWGVTCNSFVFTITSCSVSILPVPVYLLPQVIQVTEEEGYLAVEGTTHLCSHALEP